MMIRFFRSSLNYLACATSMLLAAVVVVTGVGCSSSSLKEVLPDQRLAYKKQQERYENLELPPDLTSAGFSDQLDIPAPDGAPATYSQYAGGHRQTVQATAQGEVLPTVSNVELRGQGNDRWLVVDASPGATWGKVIGFWRKQGILLVEQDPAVGLMRTDWIENRAEIRKDFLTNFLRKVVDSAYSTSTRDQYTMRLDSGARSGTTEIHLTHRGMAEKVAKGRASDAEQTIWEPSGTDTDKEAEMTRRLMLYLGASQSQTKAFTTGSAAASPKARLVTAGGNSVLIVPTEFRDAWRMTGSALNRGGFAVTDRNQSEGVYYVRYDASELAAGRKDKPGLLRRMAFWKRDKPEGVTTYQVRVAGDRNESRLSVRDTKGQPIDAQLAEQMLTLIRDDL